MGKRRKKEKRTPAEDPHGWLVDHLRGPEGHSVKAQHAVTALTGYAFIAGTEQGAGTSRPFDHQGPDDSIRIDTKSQQHGVLDVKKEKPGKQFTAWASSGKRFIPLQLVLDGKTGSWYVVPGIPTRTLGLDPLVTAFDPAEPLAPFKVAGGGLDDLLDVAVFLTLQKQLQETLSRLLREKESIMKAVDADYLVYLKSAAEDIADNPELLQAITGNEDTIRAIASNENAMRAIAGNENAIRAIAANEDAMRAIAANEDAMRAIAANEDAMRTLLGPELFEVWKNRRPS